MNRTVRAVVGWMSMCALAVAAGGAQLRTADQVHAEIEKMLQRLAASGCAFQRNGEWHTAAEASRHLRRKLAYLERRTAIASAETFIQLAAARSSESGVPYAVRCADGLPVSASEWLLAQLRALRGEAR